MERPKEFPKTRQELFDTASKWLLSQGQRSVTKEGQCRYRLNKNASDTIACAIGGCIPDDAYLSNMEARGVRILFEEFSDRLGLTDSEASKLRDVAEHLQSIHDALNPPYWYKQLVLMAETYGLSIEALPAPQDS